MCLFLTYVPWKAALRLLDCFVYDGPNVLLQGLDLLCSIDIASRTGYSENERKRNFARNRYWAHCCFAPRWQLWLSVANEGKLNRKSCFSLLLDRLQWFWIFASWQNPRVKKSSKISGDSSIRRPTQEANSSTNWKQQKDQMYARAVSSSYFAQLLQMNLRTCLRSSNQFCLQIQLILK